MAWVVPIMLDVGDEARDEDEIDRALAEGLIGDVDVAALRRNASRAAWLRAYRERAAAANLNADPECATVKSLRAAAA
jgi:hypothetical protein